MEPTQNRYLFICGCVRSGTTITTELLRRHSKIAIGRERYNSLFKSDQYNFIPSLFNKQRFCKELAFGDTHHNKLDEYYNNLFLRLDQYKYFGDKIPSLFKEYDYLMNTFFQPKIIFLLRNVIDVSQSWERRRIESISNNGKWPHDNGFSSAIKEWNMSLRNTLVALSKYPNNIFVLPYEKLFSDKHLLKEIFGFLDLEITKEVEVFWNKNTIIKKEFDQKRLINMPTEVKNLICLQADFDSYRSLKQ